MNIDIILKCSRCREVLVSSRDYLDSTDIVFKVEACKCIGESEYDRIKKVGFEAGYEEAQNELETIREEGNLEGYNQGYNEGYEEALRHCNPDV